MYIPEIVIRLYSSIPAYNPDGNITKKTLRIIFIGGAYESKQLGNPGCLRVNLELFECFKHTLLSTKEDVYSKCGEKVLFPE